MARHSSFKVIIAQETYNNFFATIRARALAQQWAQQYDPEFGMEKHPWTFDVPGNAHLPGQPANGSAGPDGAFLSTAPAHKSESWIESWLAGKTNGLMP